MGKYTDEALRMRPYLQKGAQTLGDADALAIKTVYPTWSETGSYKVDEKVLFLKVLYKCITEHDAQKGWEPANASSLWAKVLIPDPGVIPEWEQPDSTNPYKKDDKVTHNNKKWISIIDDNVWEPGVYGWEEINS